MGRGVNETGPHPVDVHVGRRVCERRLELGYNQSDLARALGLTFQQIQKYEKGANRISASKLWDISAFFKVDVDYFFVGLQTGDTGSTDVSVQSEGVFPATRYSVEAARLAPQLSSRRQKLVLDFMKSMASREAVDA